MAIQFNDTSNFNGLVQLYEEECGFKTGDISGNTDRLKKFTVAVNRALDDFFALAITSSGLQIDDTNHSDFPIITTDIVSGQRDYTVLEDETGNMVLDIFKAVLYDSSGYGRELTRANVLSDDRGEGVISDYYDGQSHPGLSTGFTQVGNSIILPHTPDYSRDDALKLYINREPSYFTYQDTTKKPGIPSLFHDYLYLKPALDYARRNNLDSYNRIEAEVIKLEGVPSKGVQGAIQRYFAKRDRTLGRRMRAAYHPTK